MICMVCHDTRQELSKICGCVESLICKSCLNELNKEKVDKCPICRNTLDIIKYLNNNIYIQYICLCIFVFISFLVINIYPIIYFINTIKNTENYTSLLYNKDFQYYTVLFNVLVIQPMVLFYITNFFKDRKPTRIINKDGILYISLLTIANFIFDIVLVSSNIEMNFFVYYFLGICIPFSIVPFILILLKLLSEYIYNIRNLINIYSRINTIQGREIAMI